MAFVREYYPSDTLKLINVSEGKMPQGGALVADAEHGGHALGRHLIGKIPDAAGWGVSGAGEKGVGYGTFRDRFLSSPTGDGGKDNLSSGWAGKGDMALLLCELLNSDVGQFALAKLDAGAERIFVHYLNQGKLASIYGKFGSLKFQESKVHVTPASQKTVSEDIYNKKTNAFIKTITKNIPIPRTATGQVSAKDVAAANALLTTYGSALHLQTFYPSSEADPSYAEWVVGMVENKASFAPGGAIVIATKAR